MDFCSMWSHHISPKNILFVLNFLFGLDENHDLEMIGFLLARFTNENFAQENDGKATSERSPSPQASVVCKPQRKSREGGEDQKMSASWAVDVSSGFLLARSPNGRNLCRAPETDIGSKASFLPRSDELTMLCRVESAARTLQSLDHTN